MLTKKAVVVETGKGWAIVLLPGGEYKKIKTNRYLEAGDLYRYRNYAGGKYLAAAAIFLTILLGSIDYYTVQAYAEVSSLELGLNRWGRVVSVQAKNDEGQRIISQVQIKNEPLENAVQKISRIVENEKPNGTGMAGKPLVKVHARGNAKPELEEKLLEKIDQKQEKKTPVKNKNEKKQELKTERKLQHLNVNNSNGLPKPESPGKPEPSVNNNNEAGSRFNDQDSEKQTGKAKHSDEELTVDKAEPSTPTIEVVPEPPKSGENKDNGKHEKNNDNKTNQDNQRQGNNQKNDNNRKNQGEH